MVRGGHIKVIGDDSIEESGKLKSQHSADPFDAAPEVSNKGFKIEAVKELTELDEDSMRGSALKQTKVKENLATDVKAGKKDEGIWDRFSELDNTDRIEGESSNLGGDLLNKKGGLAAAIKNAKADGSDLDDLANIDDDFEIDPDMMASKGKKKLGFANGREDLRQGVSSGFNFKEILKGDQACSEDDLLENALGSV